MRKCGSCGSLLLGDGETCNRCGAPLPPPAAATVAAPAVAAHGGPPVARSFGRLNIPPPVPVAPIGTPETAPAPPGGAGAYGQPPAWTPPAQPGAGPVAGTPEPWPPEPVVTTAPARSTPRATRLGAFVVALAVVAAVIVGTGRLGSHPLPAGTKDFVAGNGVVYDSPDGAFEIQLPKAPVVQSQSMTVNGANVAFTVATVSEKDYEMLAGTIVVPPGVLRSGVDKTLDDAMTQVASGTKSKLQHKTSLTRGALPAVEGQFHAGDGYSVRMLVVATDSRLIILGVHAKSGTGRLYDALDRSLIIG